jgi:broad specificity phosphatase PhoE
MAVVYLIRHGQATFGDREYDRLSPIGERQSRVLGHHLQRVLPRLDALCSGGLARQDRTAELAREAMGAERPPLRTVEAFSEYDHEALFRAYLPVFLETPDCPADSLEAVLRDSRLLERALRFVLGAWMEGREHEGAPVTSWPDFCHGATQGVERILKIYGPRARIGIFTSGGVITAVLRTLLGLSHQRALGLNMCVYNASLTQIYCTPEQGLTSALLLGFNNITYLEMTGDRDLITFR